MPPRKKTETDTLSFEQAMRELEDIVQRLETGELALEESLALYERGQRLSVHCAALLDQAELRIRRLQPTDVADEDDGPGLES